MDRYEPFCMADLTFYDKARQDQTERSDFAAVRRPVPAGWVRLESDTWMYYAPTDGPSIPAQGWKIHISARLADAERALDIMWDYCIPRGIAFKYLRGQATVLLYNAKYASRNSSGKLVTIYPRDEAELELVLKELDELLRDIQGPYILSDLRYGNGPLFVRYGGFAERKCLGENGELVAAIEDGEGRLIPDVRGTTFTVPPWTTLPEFLKPHLEARAAVSVGEMPYQIETVLHFSNGGGVYLGRHQETGERVVLKEARPYAGLDASGSDAVTRLVHERDIMRRLKGLTAVPELHDYFQLGDHHFIVQEFVDGNPLQRLLVQRYPLTKASSTAADIAEYTDWAMEMISKVGTAVTALHERGVVFRDLHPNNILVTAAGRIALIDYEVAALTTDEGRGALGNPAYAAPADRRGVEADRYALACLTIGLFAPQTTITLIIDRGKIRHLAELILRTFPVDRAVIEQACATILGDTPAEPAPRPPLPGEADWPEVRAAMHRAILASATPARDDRLFPGDVAQFEGSGGINFATGAAGVLYTLAQTGAERVPEHETWLAEHALHPPLGSRLGFYDGLNGVAYVLEHLGHRQQALDLLDLCLREKWEVLGPSLNAGLSGIGLSLLELAERTGESTLRDAADRAVELCAERLGGPEDVPEISGGSNPRAGLMHGSCGPALLFLHAYERSGDTALLDKAADALRQDLRRCIRAGDGSLQVNQGWRYLPYLDEGSVGIGLVLARYLAHRHDDGLSRDLTDLTRITRSRYFVQSGLFTGRAGIVAGLAMGLPGTPENLAEQIRGLHWHALSYRDGLAFPGDQLLRLSMDFATGTAGVLFALQAALGDAPVHLPFIGPPGHTEVSGRRHLNDREEV
jgi:class III lanthionine synthetase